MLTKADKRVRAQRVISSNGLSQEVVMRSSLEMEHLESFAAEARGYIEEPGSSFDSGDFSFLVKEFVNCLGADTFRATVHVSPATISRWRRGSSIPPYIITRRAVCADLLKQLEKVLSEQLVFA